MHGALLVLLMLAASLFSARGVGSILPVAALLNQPELIHSTKGLASTYRLLVAANCGVSTGITR
jgi:hypothetical protein